MAGSSGTTARRRELLPASRPSRRCSWLLDSLHGDPALRTRADKHDWRRWLVQVLHRRRIGGRFFWKRTRERNFFCGRKFFFRGRECARTVLKRKKKILRAHSRPQFISVRSRAGNVLDMPSVSESPKDLTNHEATSGLL